MSTAQSLFHARDRMLAAVPEDADPDEIQASFEKAC